MDKINNILIYLGNTIYIVPTNSLLAQLHASANELLGIQTPYSNDYVVYGAITAIGLLITVSHWRWSLFATSGTITAAAAIYHLPDTVMDDLVRVVETSHWAMGSLFHMAHMFENDFFDTRWDSLPDLYRMLNEVVVDTRVAIDQFNIHRDAIINITGGTSEELDSWINLLTTYANDIAVMRDRCNAFLSMNDYRYMANFVTEYLTIVRDRFPPEVSYRYLTTPAPQVGAVTNMRLAMYINNPFNEWLSDFSSSYSSNGDDPFSDTNDFSDVEDNE